MNVGQTVIEANVIYKVQRILPNGDYVLSPYDVAGPTELAQFKLDVEPVPTTIEVEPWELS